MSKNKRASKHSSDFVPSLRKDLQNAKILLQKNSNVSGDSLYDHLTRIISKVIDERPKDIIDYFELFSERVRAEKFQMGEMKLEEAYKEPERLKIAQQQLTILISQSQHTSSNVNEKRKDVNGIDGSELSTESIANGDDEDEDGDEESDVIYEATAVKDLCELQFYWNLFGIGFSREEVFSLSCSLRQLKKNKNAIIATCRFWGKIFGLQKDYYVAECTLTAEGLEKRIDAIESTINVLNLEPSSDDATSSFNSSDQQHKRKNPSKVELIDDSEENKEKNDENSYPAEWNFSMNIPESSYRTPIEIPCEDIGHGINRYVYFVCNNLNDSEWIELPSATPHQINVSRRIKRYLTGNLDAEINAYPSFPGNEQNYLRSLIARISAGTHVAPKNFYKIGKDDENEEDAEFEDDDFEENIYNNDKPIRVNTSYRPLSLEKLLKLENFVHIKPEILKQGRVCFFNGKSLFNNNINDNDEEDEDDDSESFNKNLITIPEVPIPLFASCSNDQFDEISPWTVRQYDVLDDNNDFPFVLLKSNIWPGAFAFVKERICDNIYIGYGHKNSSLNHSPPALPQMKMEDCSGVDAEDVCDPSIEEEKNFAAKKLSDDDEKVEGDGDGDDDNNDDDGRK